ncbi:MAG: hypothetical protein AB8B57_00260 [Congregibacter sp.]
MEDDTPGPDDECEESLLIALDQLSQTIDVMSSVVGRLRHQIEEQSYSKEAEIRQAMRPDRILH